MQLRRLSIACAIACSTLLLAQDGYDRDAYARDHVRFLVLQLDQWSKEFPQQFYAALMRPPVDSTKLSATAKAAAGDVGEAIHQLAALSDATDVMTNAKFRRQLDRTLAAS